MPRKKTSATGQAHVIDNLVSTVASMQVELRKSTDQVENLILMMNAKAAVEPDAGDIAMVASSLVGVWIDRQQSEGALTVDLRRVADVRAGIELALT